MSSENSNTSPLSDKVLEVIEKEGLKPKPRWHFFVKEWVVWVVAFFALGVGSMATALTLYIANASRFIEHHIVFSDIRYLFQMVPFAWILLGGIALFYTVYALRETRRGYKWSASWLVGVALGVSMILGIGVYATGFSEYVDRYLLNEIPLYKPLTNFQPKLWMDERSGIVAGMVTEVLPNNTFEVQKIDGSLLKVELSTEFDRGKMAMLQEGVRMRFIGTSTKNGDEDVFIVENVEPFRGRGGMMMQKGHLPPPEHFPPPNYLKEIE